MSGCAFLFPGQASQTVGMARDLFEQYESVRERFAQADEDLGFKLSQICFEGPEDRLMQTEVTQPAVFVHSVAACELLMAKGLEPIAVAGHSLGEYSALVAAGALSFEAALALVGPRGKLMQAAGVARPGAMGAVIGLGDDAQITTLCEQAADVGVVVAANFNAPGQVVVSGEQAGVARLGELALGAGAKRFVELAVSGAFHSPLMQPAAEQMEALLQAAPIVAPRVPVLTNVSAAPVVDPEELRSHLIQQITSSVRWTETVRKLAAMGIDRAYEIGPGAVLKGLVRRIEHGLVVDCVGKVEEIAVAKGVE
ncbi:MAG TPA: ACP S-malonyltransferase [Candidatus Handelsmanbacteria bacterium]|nr:ACP S-malonyltransferase [Candidatus Handelsmanbacteria bacterium]